MRATVSIIESVHESAVREINALEERIEASESVPDALLWEQAEAVVKELKAGMKQRELASKWLNVRETARAKDGKPVYYSQVHVVYTKQAFDKHAYQIPRPRFRDAYNDVAHLKAHVANNSGNNEWYTPPEIIEAARQTMGGIDCDPASSEIANQVVKAETFYTEADDGLTLSWPGRVWMNPPYAQPAIAHFSAALIDRVGKGETEQACVLVNNATETGWCQPMIERASAVCLVRGRVKFTDPEGNPSGAPLQGQIVIYIGKHADRFVRNFEPFGPVLFTANERQ